MVIKYPNFNKFPFFLTTTDTDNNLLIDLVDRAKTAETADSVNWSGVNIDTDKDMNLKSLTNLNKIQSKEIEVNKSNSYDAIKIIENGIVKAGLCNFRGAGGDIQLRVNQTAELGQINTNYSSWALNITGRSDYISFFRNPPGDLGWKMVLKTTGDGLYPGLDNTYVLGSSTLRWADISTIKINTKTVTPGYVIQQTGGSYSDSTSHSFADGTGGIIYSTDITKSDIDQNNYSKIIVEVDAYVDKGNKLLIVKLFDSNGNQIRSGYENVRNTTTQTKKFEFILEDPNTYTIKVITQPVFDSGTLTTTGFRVYW